MNNNKFKKPMSLVDQLKHDLSRAIIKGVLRPGERIKEAELQELFKVSRAPIREALRLLEGEGLIVVDNYKKRNVRQITNQDLADMFPVMACLEGLAAKKAVSTISNAKIKLLIETNKQLKTAGEQMNYGLCAEANFKFHKMIIREAKNKAINTAIRSISKGVIWLWLTNIYFKMHEIVHSSVDEHAKIIEAFQNNDADAAEREVRNHINKISMRTLEFSIYDSGGNYVLDKRFIQLSPLNSNVSGKLLPKQKKLSIL